ncbi:hypothetical protein KKF91_15225 [Myxococcota bacterium]|nr:hypothetical protein [Myxococcota bacterium]MBU1431892.1 hypothetical protein [Myxococcota bacterium]MBU1896956.1 hypothetical protein [Myxococcota bacterium]
MSDIYQRIWRADQAAHGVPALLDTEDGDPELGYVKVSPEGTGADHQLLPEVVIPASKQTTYTLCQRLFNNYALAEGAREVDTPQERQELEAFLDAILDAPPMRIAREHISAQAEAPLDDEAWRALVVRLWFERFASKGDPDLTGFEHVVVGEQEGGKVQGYHFWYKYHLDDGQGRLVDGERGPIEGAEDDRITYTRARSQDGQVEFPESVTFAFRWDAPDYDADAVRPLHKRKGGFFVGCSVEGLMALGTVRAWPGAPREAIIEGARYTLKLYHSPDGRHIRTFYPVFEGASEATQRALAAAPDPAMIAATDWVIFKRYHEALEARIVAGLLSSEGIPTRLLDEHTINTDWFLSNAIGGVKLQVPKADLGRATALLKAQLSDGGPFQVTGEPWRLSRLAPVAWLFLALTVGGLLMGLLWR